MRIIWNAEVMWQQKADGKSNSLLAPTDKKAKQVRALLFCD